MDRRSPAILHAATATSIVATFVVATFVAAALAWTVTAANTLSTTFDEPHHLTTGLAWWQYGNARWWTENPPLPKIVVAALPYAAGLRLRADPASTPNVDPWDAGLALLDGRPDAQRLMFLARLGTVAFLLVALGATWVLAGGRRRPLAALLATALAATYPPLLGHGGLATTDVAAVATVLLFVLALARWADGPTRGRAAAVGAAFAGALLCKLTAPLFCGGAAVGWLAARRLTTGAWLGTAAGTSRTRRDLLADLAIAALVAFGVVWAGFRFSLGRLEDFAPADYIGTPVIPPPGARSAFMRWLCHLPLPAPEVLHGALFLRAHDLHGHTAFLFGRLSEHGFWNFYLVGVLLKSPLPFLAAVLASVAATVVVAARALNGGVRALDPRTLGAGLAATATLALSTFMTVNIGMRHLLCAIPLLAIFAGRTLAALVEATATRRRRTLVLGALAALLVANVAIVQRAHPELFAYFNPLAGREPGHALIDSDLDWAQDMGLLKRELRERKITSLHYGLFAVVNPCDPEMPTLHPLEPGKPVTGWVVLSEQFYRSTLHFSFRRESCAPGAAYKFHDDPPTAFDWLKPVQPVARIGASLRLYHLPER